MEPFLATIADLAVETSNSGLEDIMETSYDVQYFGYQKLLPHSAILFFKNITDLKL